MKICSACGERFSKVECRCPSCYHSPDIIDGYLTFAPKLAEASDGYEASIFPKLAPLESKNFWFRSRNRLIIWALRSYFPQAENFLEIGCGTGFVLSGIEQAFPQLDLYGSEIFTTGLDFAARRLSRSQLFQMDACQIPFEQEFDVIGAFDVLEHIQEDQNVLYQMYQALRPGGGLLLTVPQHPWLWSQADEYAHHVRRYRAKELKRKVESAGFKVLKITSFVFLLLPLMMVSRLQKQKSNANYDIFSELNIGKVANFILEKILDFELISIQSKISFPLGGSLLLVAHKSRTVV